MPTIFVQRPIESTKMTIREIEKKLKIPKAFLGGRSTSTAALAAGAGARSPAVPPASCGYRRPHLSRPDAIEIAIRIVIVIH